MHIIYSLNVNKSKQKQLQLINIIMYNNLTMFYKYNVNLNNCNKINYNI